ncbi:MAG: tetratricopeptide repeat protein [Chitinophagaceae bacterium]|nr:tetratricopeptide repeat protein [Chitinophagaceae bacterium]
MAEITGYLDRANLLLNQGRPKEAGDWVRKVLEAEPENDYALSVLSRCYLNTKEFDKGIDVIKKAIHIDPTEPHYHYLAAFGYYQKNERDLAQKYLQQAIQLNPYYAEYFGLLAYLCLDRNDFKEALKNADQGLSVDSENITCLNARSTALNKLKLTDDAIATMQNALAMDPDNEFTHVTMGWNFLEKGKHKNAAMHFREALRINPDYQNAKVGLKEALKSKIAPYRWLLQYGFWLRNKGKQFRWGFIIAIFIGVRIIIALSHETPGFEKIGILVAALYFLMVATSWIINPLANVFLLLHKEGKYALTDSEKWNAIAFAGCILAGAGVICLTAFTGDRDQSADYLVSGLILVSLCIPMGHMNFPVKLKRNSFSQWIEIALIVFALASVICALTGFSAIAIVFTIYLVLFVIYTWAKAF